MPAGIGDSIASQLLLAFLSRVTNAKDLQFSDGVAEVRREEKDLSPFLFFFSSRAREKELPLYRGGLFFWGGGGGVVSFMGRGVFLPKKSFLGWKKEEKPSLPQQKIIRSQTYK